MSLILHSQSELGLKNPAAYYVKSYTHRIDTPNACIILTLSFLHNRQHAVLNQLLLFLFIKGLINWFHVQIFYV